MGEFCILRVVTFNGHKTFFAVHWYWVIHQSSKEQFLLFREPMVRHILYILSPLFCSCKSKSEPVLVNALDRGNQSNNWIKSINIKSEVFNGKNKVCGHCLYYLQF